MDVTRGRPSLSVYNRSKYRAVCIVDVTIDVHRVGVHLNLADLRRDMWEERYARG